MKHIILLLFFLVPLISREQLFNESGKSAECSKIKNALLVSWEGYKKYAAGYDELQPLSHKGRNWYKVSFEMTPLDAFDTFILTGMKDQAAEAKTMVLKNLDFNVDQEVQLFEINIRILGGLLSSYEFTNDQALLKLAVDLGNRLLPAFRSATGMPFRFVNLKTGATRDPLSNPAEISTYLLEFGKLTQLTKDSVYWKTAKKAAFEVYNRKSNLGLVGTVIDVNTGQWINTESRIGARIDSWYEYLFKAWKLTGDKDCYEAWKSSNETILKLMVRETDNGCFITRVDMNTGNETHPYYGALDAFYAGILALSGDLENAKCIQDGNYYMWTKNAIEPEEFNFMNDSIIDPAYPLRPENIESCFYLYRMTKDYKYLLMGWRMIEDILAKCKTDAGFAGIKNVKTMELDDKMESFFLAETLKYAFLLFAPESTISLDQYVFTTEAHPLKIIRNVK